MSTSDQIYILQLEEYYRELFRRDLVDDDAQKSEKETESHQILTPPLLPPALALSYKDAVVPRSPAPDDIKNPHLLLHNIYSDVGLFKHREETAEERLVPHVFQMNNGEPVPLDHKVVDEETFFKKWESFTKGMLKGLDWTHLFVAGGSVLGCLLDETTSSFEDSDIDLFLHGVDAEDEEKQNEVLRHLVEVIVKNTKASGNARVTSSAVTIFAPFPFRNVQLVLTANRSPAEILINFDVDCCAVGFDGKNVWALERARRSITTSCNYYTLVPSDNIPKRYERRLFKYSKRGFMFTGSFQLAVPHLKREGVDPMLYKANLNDLEGHDLLLRYDELASRPHIHFVTNWSHSMDESLSGGRLRCKVCKKILTEEDMTEDLKARLSKYGVSREMNWIKEKAVLQDYERNKYMDWQRSFGNYTPAVNSHWEAGAYVDDKDIVDIEQLPAPREEDEEESVDLDEVAQIFNELKNDAPKQDHEFLLALLLSYIADFYRAKRIDQATRSKLKSILFSDDEYLRTQRELLYEGMNILIAENTKPSDEDVLRVLQTIYAL